MTTIPASWQRLIDEAREHDPDAIIAGGAIRDLICGRKPKDIDLFTTSIDLYRWETIFPSHNYPKEATHPYSILGVYTFKKEGLTCPFQVVRLSTQPDPLELIESFDFGICMAAYDGKEIIRSRHFEEDIEKRVFTLRHCRSLAQSKKRWSRISWRYWRWSGRRWPMVLSGKARLDLMLQGLEAKGKLTPPSFRYY